MTADSNQDRGDGVTSIELGVSRRNLMKQLSAVGLAGGLSGLAGCGGLRSTENTETPGEQDDGGNGQNGGGGSDELPTALRVPLVAPPTADSMDLSNPSNEEREMVFVTHVVDEFMTGIIVGMNDALNNVGWSGEFIGPSSHDPAQQVETLNTTISRLRNGKDAIATSILNRTQYTQPVKNAINNNIPVASFNTSVYSGEYKEMMDKFGIVIPYVGQKFVEAGVAVGQTGYERAKEKVGDDTQIVALPTTSAPDHPALSARAEGIRMALEAQGDVEVLDTLNVSGDQAQAINRVDTKHKSNPDINLILGTALQGAIAGGRLVENQGLKDEMTVGGFDLPEPTLQGIRKGTIEFTAGQDPYSQGNMPVNMMWNYMERGIPMKDFNTGISVIDQSNIEFASRRSGSWGDLQNWQKQNY
ncbi:substrate-binding domain-containing protein [Haloarcula nitratireducens]|uniref:Substrate-binding domain-containing protein n=1 Tax=Haloarcula nitratireducens TaxID=2487749 RepID=A0AAW4PGJ9_9EURY|nr:substrate-binding domain-containing protein [Halomicroarcula nitratireducens]MBX0296872.1 substrate-binding domain-containing protein [Halomicroarcula nitratireducens]